MARPRSVNKSDLERAVAVALAQNLTIREILVEPGSARVIIGAGAKDASRKAAGGPKDWPSE